MPIEDAVSGTTSATTLAKPGSPRSRAYVTFLDGNSKCVTGVVGLAESLRKVNTSYRLVVAVLPGVPEEHRSVLVAKDCIVREIEPVHVPKNLTQFAMADYGINYSKLRMWEDFLNMFFRDIYKPIPPIYNLVLAMLWRHPENIELNKVKVVHYCASGSKPWRYTGKEENMDRKDIKMLVKSWWDLYNDESLDYKRTNISPIEGEADKVIVTMVSEANAGHYTPAPPAA